MRRLVILETIYHQDDGCQPTSIDGGFAVSKVSEEEPYHRALLVDAEWRILDLGWAKDCSQLVLINPRPRRDKNPTAEEAEAANSLVIEVGIGSEVFAELHVGESMRLRPAQQLSVRCRGGKSKVMVHAFL